MMRNIVVIAIVVCVIVAVLIAAQAGANRYLPAYIEKQLNATDEMQYAFNRLHVNLFTRHLSITAFSCSGVVEDTGISLTAETIDAFVDWKSVFRSELVFDDLVAEHIRCEVVKEYITPQKPMPQSQLPAPLNLGTFFSREKSSSWLKNAYADEFDVLPSERQTPFFIKRTTLNDISFTLTDVFTEKKTSTSTTFNGSLTVYNAQYPVNRIRKGVDIEINGSILGEKKGHGRIFATINSFSPVSANFNGNLEHIFIPHFKNYFQQKDYVIKNGYFSIESSGTVISNQLKSENMVTLSEFNAEHIDFVRDKPTADILPYEVLGLSRKTIINTINFLAKDSMSFRFTLKGDVLKGEFDIAETFKSALRNAIKSKIIRQAEGRKGLIDSLAQSLLNLPTDTSSKLIDKADKVDENVQQDLGRVLDSLKGILEDSRK